MDYRAIRTDQYKLVHWMQHPDDGELYDLANDPYEMTNLIDDPGMAGVIHDLRAEMASAVIHAMGLPQQ
jgi:arylsulfatase A-like enzyme